MEDDARGEVAAADARVAAVRVGPVVPLNGPIHLAPYDPAWPTRFAERAREIRAALGAAVRLLEHVGSTSVPGLVAKSVVDMVLAVDDSADEGAYVPPLERIGYVLRVREPDWFEHRLLKAPGLDGNLHVFGVGCAEIGRMIAFRDRLRASEADRRLYADTKRALAARTWRYTQDYADAKADVVRAILARAP